MIEIKSDDETLAAAFEVWADGFAESHPDTRLILTDLDTRTAGNEKEEITLSKVPGRAMLLRPFSFDELEKLILSREKAEKEGKTNEKARLLFDGEKVFLDGKELRLTPLERRLLEILHEAREPLCEKELSRLLFGEERVSDQIRVYVSYLRKKTDVEGKERLILTEFGKGYYIRHE